MTFTVVSNPSVAADFTRATRRSVERGDARALLTDRQFHIAGQDMLAECLHVNTDFGGVFLVGKRAPRLVNEIRRVNPLLPIVLEPLALKEHWATPTEPFLLDDDPHSIFPLTLDAALDLQLMSGSDLAVTPTGQIKAGDSASLKAALVEVNALDRKDILFALPMAAGWLSQEQYLRQLIAVINRSRHPVLLCFTSTTNPLESTKRLRAYRRLFDEVIIPIIAYRTDLAGFDALAHGALASAIGSYPSLRRLDPVGKHGFAVDPEDLSPHMLIDDMLRFVRSTHMRREWFAGATPIVCFCAICRGSDLDRLHGSNAERGIGHRHNVIGVDTLFSAHQGLTQPQRRRLWTRQTADALDTYPQLESHIGRSVKIPADLKVWAR